LTPGGQQRFKRDPAFTRRIQGILKSTYYMRVLLEDQNIEIHHRNPLFLGGEENAERNALVLSQKEHRDGHASLNHQPQMKTPPPPLRPLQPYILKHPTGTAYYLAGMKNERDQTCVGAVIPGMVVPCSCEDPDPKVLLRNLLEATGRAPATNRINGDTPPGFNERSR
jgi:hypothetical protein